MRTQRIIDHNLQSPWPKRLNVELLRVTHFSHLFTIENTIFTSVHPELRLDSS